MTESEIAVDRDGWEVAGTTTNFADSHLRVVTDRVRTPTREDAVSWTIVQRNSAVVIAPMTPEGKFVLIRQERIPIRATIWEMPAGQVEELCDTGSFQDVALRELREETGYELAPGGELIFLGEFYSSPGFTDERAFQFLARPVRPSPQGAAHHESEAIVDCREFSPDELKRMIAEGEIRDANTLGMYARLTALRILESDSTVQSEAVR